MVQYLIKRITTMIVVLWMAATLAYFTVHVTPGDTASALLISVYGEEAVSEENMKKVQEKFDLNRSIQEQYLEWLGNLLTGNLGISYQYQKPVFDLLKARLPNTILLGSASFLISILISIPLGILSALNQNKLIDHSSRLVMMLFSSFPSFWIALLMIYLFSIHLKILPVSGMNHFNSIILPALTLSFGMTATTTRMMRASMLDAMGQDYIFVAKAKGLKQNKIIIRHVLRNAIPPVITVLGLQIGHILGGAVVIENLFSWPGIGGLLVDSISAKDLPMIEGCVLVIAFGYALINLIVDILYTCVNPKVRYLEGKKSA